MAAAASRVTQKFNFDSLLDYLFFSTRFSPTHRTFDADMELMSWQAVFSPVCGSFLTERLACGVRGRRNSQLFNDAMFRRQATGRNNGRRGEQD